MGSFIREDKPDSVSCEHKSYRHLTLTIYDST